MIDAALLVFAVLIAQMAFFAWNTKRMSDNTDMLLDQIKFLLKIQRARNLDELTNNEAVMGLDSEQEVARPEYVPFDSLDDDGFLSALDKQESALANRSE